MAGSRTLDPDSKVPLYFQLGAVLREKLDAGAWPPGSRLPTERELEEVFGVSRSVTRGAFELLEKDGVVYRRRGSGAFVSESRRELEVFGLLRILVDPTPGLSLAIRRAREELPDTAVARFLDLDPGEVPVLHITAVARIGPDPVCLLDSYCAIELSSWLLAAVEALGGEQAAPGSPPRLGDATAFLELTSFSSWGGPQLGAAPGTPALMARLTQLGRAKGDRREHPLEFAHLIYNATTTQLVLGRC